MAAMPSAMATAAASSSSIAAFAPPLKAPRPPLLLRSSHRCRRASRPLVTAKFYGESKHYLVNKVSRTELDKLLDPDRSKSVIVDFYATWCGPCVILAQELERLAVEFGHVIEFVKIDTDEEYELAQKMEVRGLPTVIFVSKDAEKNAIRTEGIFPREIYRDIIKDHLL